MKNDIHIYVNQKWMHKRFKEVNIIYKINGDGIYLKPKHIDSWAYRINSVKELLRVFSLVDDIENSNMEEWYEE